VVVAACGADKLAERVAKLRAIDAPVQAVSIDVSDGAIVRAAFDQIAANGKLPPTPTPTATRLRISASGVDSHQKIRRFIEPFWV
jgi:NAD(P)-dependent dehydrogenase (short-subunit alcohol dehydrogenase family)